jgi:hypothetical protein
VKPFRRKMTKAQRRDFYNAAKGDNEFPVCNICGLPVRPCHDWVESHLPIPRAWKGKKTGVAHARCNQERRATVEAKMFKKANHQYDMARGIKVSRNPLPGGKDDPRKRTIDGRVIDRRTGELWSSRGRG